MRAWVIRKGYKAPQAAGTIHTDFEKGFICAEVMAFDDLKELENEADVKAKGKYRQEGKMYTGEREGEPENTLEAGARAKKRAMLRLVCV